MFSVDVSTSWFARNDARRLATSCLQRANAILFSSCYQRPQGRLNLHARWEKSRCCWLIERKSSINEKRGPDESANTFPPPLINVLNWKQALLAINVIRSFETLSALVWPRIGKNARTKWKESQQRQWLTAWVRTLNSASECFLAIKREWRLKLPKSILKMMMWRLVISL